MDMLDFVALEATIRSCFGARLKTYEHLRGTFNFDDFVAGYRPAGEDHNINISRYIHTPPTLKPLHPYPPSTTLTLTLT
jgi:hypothetical protein